MPEERKIDQGKLHQAIQEASTQFNQLKKLNQYLSTSIGLFGVALRLGATVSGIVAKDARIAAIFGACSATTQAILFAYPTDRRASAYRILFTKNENLRIDLEVRQQTNQSLEKILNEFQFIKAQAALEEATTKKPENSVNQQANTNPVTSQADDVNNAQELVEPTANPTKV